MIPSIDQLAAMLISLAIAWGVPVAYLLLCVISDRRSRARAVPLPADIDATPTAPNLHPVLLGALRCHDETSRGNESNAYETALGAVVAMIGRGELRFEDKAPRGAADAESTLLEDDEEGPVVAENHRRRRRRKAVRDERVHAFGAHLWLTRPSQEARGASASDNRARARSGSEQQYDADALRLVMPPQASRANLEELYSRASDAYRPLGSFLVLMADDLVALGLTRRPGALYRIVFSWPITVFTCLWCLFGPALALLEPGTAGSAVACVMMIAVMLGRAMLVDLGTRLTPEGARVLAQGHANIRWAECLSRGTIALPGRLSPDEVTRLLATLLAMGRHDLAGDVADCLMSSGYARVLDSPHARQAIDFCMRRPYIDTSVMRKDLSPADLLIESIDKTMDIMRG